MALKAGQTIEGIRQGRPSTSTSAPAPDPNLMDLSAFQKATSNQSSDTKRARWVQLKLCFRCGQAGHISRGCLNGSWKQLGHLQPSLSARLSKIQAEINFLRANPSASSPAPPSKNAGLSKNGSSQV
ncbi:uncharacterized protein VP01_6544g1 [Puccinia sorghi]|uniref:CCHC-type domain-containing protein n=1 Tax=Puccinia sorghi TaxID=27349 RepID=A0A0L6UHK2_9BASI|nr:uncharacterized protein VP01_6544g1 [Puccinia sorghi]